jgi:hypothetical protein
LLESAVSAILARPYSIREATEALINGIATEDVMWHRDDDLYVSPYNYVDAVRRTIRFANRVQIVLKIT